MLQANFILPRYFVITFSFCLFLSFGKHLCTLRNDFFPHLPLLIRYRLLFVSKMPTYIRCHLILILYWFWPQAWEIRHLHSHVMRTCELNYSMLIMFFSLFLFLFLSNEEKKWLKCVHHFNGLEYCSFSSLLSVWDFGFRICNWINPCLILRIYLTSIRENHFPFSVPKFIG